MVVKISQLALSDHIYNLVSHSFEFNKIRGFSRRLCSAKLYISFSNSPEYYAVYPREIFLHFSDRMRDANYKFNGLHKVASFSMLTSKRRHQHQRATVNSSLCSPKSQ